MMLKLSWQGCARLDFKQLHAMHMLTTIHSYMLWRPALEYISFLVE